MSGHRYLAPLYAGEEAGTDERRLAWQMQNSTESGLPRKAPRPIRITVALTSIQDYGMHILFLISPLKLIAV